eukprot:TRINITY_DN363_c0_g1_i2.p1 TRINITY_DN363_c0_g1~~TRINITY_DN363_c0_g1_i2.p1  ORF type:complete len:186 (+),score=38.46 TRINITY_DN363_c0_g1_i2:217-774(+)
MESDMGSARYTAPAPEGMESFTVEAKAPRHIVTTVFHLAFKIASVVLYLFASLLFKGDFVVPFIICVILVAVDFWITKNISGRLLVGLRWWNEVKDDGTNEWIFESLEKTAVINPVESKVFWGSLFLYPAFWLAFLLANIFRIPPDVNWGVLCGITFAMGIANVIGCRLLSSCSCCSTVAINNRD